MTFQAILGQVQRIIPAVQQAKINPNEITEVTNLIQACLEVLTSLRQTGAPTCLPPKEAFAAQQHGQLLWNSVSSLTRAEWKFSDSGKEIKRNLRYLATLLYLHGSNAFSSTPMRNAYFQCHPLEGEKCILLCLKTAKEFSEALNTDVTSSLLSLASAVRQSCVWSVKKACQFDIELLFAELAVHKDLKQWDQVVDKAKKLFEMSGSRLEQREALLNFVYTLGEQPMETVEYEPHLRDLLALSIHAQRSSHKDQNFLLNEQVLLGVTFIQMAVSFNRSGLHEEALPYADAAYAELHSSEALVLKSVTLALLHRTDEVLSVFVSLLHSRTLSPNDTFTLAFNLAKADAGCISGLLRALKTDTRYHTANEPSEEEAEYLFFFTNFVVYFCPAEGLEDVLYAAQRIPVHSPLSRGFFQLLWELSQSTTTGFLAQQKVLLIETLLRFSVAATEEELEMTITVMAQIAVEAVQNPEVNREDVLSPVKRAYATFPSLPYGLYSKMIKCQIDFFTISDFSLSRTLDQLTTQENPDMDDLVPALISLLYFFMEHHAPAHVSEISRRALSLLPPDRMLAERVLFFKAFAVSWLDVHQNLEDNQSVNTMEMSYIVEEMKKIQEAETVKGAACEWWCAFLWYASDYVEHFNKSIAAELSSCAVQLWLQHRPEDFSNDLIAVSRVFLLLNLEFDVFINGAAVLSLSELDVYLNVIASMDENRRGEQQTTVYLAQCERALRSYADGVGSTADCVEVLSTENVKACGCSFEDCEALWVAAMIVLHIQDACEIRRAIADILLFAANQLAETCDCPCTAALTTFYRAYTVSVNIVTQYTICAALATLIREKKSPLFTLQRKTTEEEEEEQEQEQHEEALFNDKNPLESITAQSILEFFAVETWNTAVKYNVARDASNVERWRGLSMEFCSVLSETHYAHQTLKNFYAEMPIM